MNKKTIYLSLLFAIVTIYQFKDIIFSDFKIILFVGILLGLFGIIYYFSFSIFKRKDMDDHFR